MEKRSVYYFYIFLTIFFTVAGQIVIKWQIAKAGALPPDAVGKAVFLLRQLLNPWIGASLAGALLAALCWMAAMTHFELSAAYPFMSLTLLFVMLFSVLILGEQLTWYKCVGTALVMSGLILLAR